MSSPRRGEWPRPAGSRPRVPLREGVGLALALLLLTSPGAFAARTVPAVGSPGSAPGSVPSPATVSRANASPIPGADPSVTLARENMPWLCLGCGLSNTAALSELARMSENQSAVSYIQYFVTSTGGFYCQCPDGVNASARALHLEAYPMINSGDTAGADDLALLQHENWWPGFIQAAVDTAVNASYAGYNVDFEGTGSGTPPANTSANYAHFLWDFANASHARGLRVSIDYGWFDPELWDPAYLSATSVDVFYDMDYYNWSLFWNRLDLDLANYPLDRLGIALSGDTGAGNTCPGDVGMGGFAQRLHILESYNITHTAFWAMADWAVGNGCWDYPPGVGSVLHDFLYNGSSVDNWTLGMGNAPNGWAFCPEGVAVNGSPPAVTCPSGSSAGTNVTLYTANDTGSVGPVTIEGNETATRVWSSPLDEVQLRLWEYRDDRYVAVTVQGLSCGTGTVVTSQTVPGGTSWYQGTLDLRFPPGQVCGLRLEMASSEPGSETGANDWFVDFGISIPPPLAVNVTASALSGPAPLSVQFHSAVSGGTPNYTYAWSFGDQNTSTGPDPAHVFERPGQYAVSLSVTDALGEVRNASLLVDASVPPPLIVNMTVAPTVGIAPLRLSCAADAHGGHGGPYLFTWSFGNASNGTSSFANLTLAQPGNYTINVTVQDAMGDVAHSVSQNVVVLPALVLDLHASRTTLTTGSPLLVWGNASGGLAPYSFVWSGFPPGCASSNQSPLSCNPDRAGNYTITLFVTDHLSPSEHAQRSVQITVVSPPCSSCNSTGLWGGASSWGLLVLVLGIVLVALVVVVVWRRSRRRPEEPRPDPRA